MRATGTLLLMLIAALIQGTIQTQSICGAKHSGRLGQTVQLKITEMTGDYILKLTKNSTTIFRFKRSETTFPDSGLKERFKFLSATGTLKIDPAQSSDSGSYTIETFTTSGISTGKCTFQLIIEAPVTTPVVTHSCGDDLKATVTCSSSGTSPQYSWSLDGRPLSEADADINRDNRTIQLKRNVAGELTCTVSSNINSESKTHQLPGCHAPVTTPVVTQSCDNDKATVTCSSSGTSPQYSWSLDGRSLSEADADISSTVRLKRNVAGELTCTVSNNANSKSETHQPPGCQANINTAASLTTVHPPLTKTDEGKAWTTLQLFLYVFLPCSAGLGLLNFVMVIVFVYMSTRERRSPQKAVG